MSDKEEYSSSADRLPRSESRVYIPSLRAIPSETDEIQRKTFDIGPKLYGLPGNYNFWSLEFVSPSQEGFRQAIIKRVDCGRPGIESLQLMLSERASIEKQVAQLYQEWSNRWKQSFIKRSHICSWLINLSHYICRPIYILIVEDNSTSHIMYGLFSTSVIS